MKLTKTYLIICFLLTKSLIIFGQYSFTQISKEQGLSHNQVECIIKDSHGFMWFGTRNGLCRFDGYEIKIYRNSSVANSISGNRILSIAEDDYGYLWIGTYQNGLNRFDPKTNEFKHYGSDYYIGEQVYRIKTLKDSTICFGTNNGLILYNSRQDSFSYFTPFNTDNQMNSYLVSDILETENGNIYIATWENDIQLFERETRKFTSIKYNPLNRPVTNYKKRLLEDLEGNIWISANVHGICRYNPKTGESRFFYMDENQLNSEVLNGVMTMNSDGKIWIATDGGGINILDPKTEIFEYLTYSEGQNKSLPSNNVYTVYKDNSDRMWVGTFNKGIAFYDPQMNKFSNSILPEHVHSFFSGKPVISIFQDSNKNLWIGTDGFGLHKISTQNTIKSYYFDEENPNSISSNVITSLNENSKGELLIGTYTGGLNVLNFKTDKIKRFIPNQENSKSLHSDNVWSMLKDSENKIWLGLLGNGVDVFDVENESFKNIGPFSNELIKVGNPNIMAILEDADGDIWFGSEGDGIFVYDKQAGKMLRPASDSEHNILLKGTIKDLFQDSYENIWIATEGTGLFKYNKGDKSLIHFGTEDGMPGAIVLAVEEDIAGNIWVSTYDGLCILRKSNNNFTTFGTYDGLSSNEFNARTLIKLADGNFLAGSMNGIDIFNPLTISFNQNIPKIVFTRLTILNQEVNVGDTINKRVVLENDISQTESFEIKYSDKIFSIEFAALNYTHPQKCKYRYMLEGFDDDWINTTPDRRFASYSNLPNGDYQFKVQASNNDGKWGNNTEVLAISVLPPFWKTTWFILLIAVTIVGMLATVYMGRLRNIRNKFLQEKANQEKRIIELEKENVETELQKLTYYTVNRNRVLINYKNRLVALSAKAKESVQKGLMVVIDEIDHEITDDKEWKYIEPRLDKFYNDFITKLRELHPDLSLSEIKIATYVRMNLSSKEISEFMHKTIRAVESDRYRLRKKINLDSNESLQSYLLNL